MFRRLILDDSAALFTLTAFITAASIYATFVWRALRMKRGQVERFENLPFETPTPACVGAQSCCAFADTANAGRSKTAPLQT